jgi:adenylate cyclase
MGTEIEHKFLVKTALLPKSSALPVGQHFIQGYLSLEPCVRVRLVREFKTHVGRKIKHETAFLTIKGKGLRVRAEFEYPLPPSDARKLLKLCGTFVLEKVRRRFGPIELDEFLGRLKGLWLAEIELPNKRCKLPSAKKLPAWIGQEVTDDPRYTNVKLVLGDKSWPSKRTLRKKVTASN